MSKPDDDKTAHELIEELERLQVAGDEIRAKIKETIEKLREVTGRVKAEQQEPDSKSIT
jgi:hypothetical protein